ncbi:YpbF family protein [Lederbergia panacisoli]|uniref:YpbF family protein n=1 Tax=Lederbergia panacisoli TaxID=1255251 RepID=UPI00214C6578|nr:YpbF family protein [Lederbergia panacisoli]MCR2820264.1 YpbF family protein [Lederbergia panacisoli]
MMEAFLVDLGNHTDQTTKQMLQNLINKRIKYNRYKNIHFLLLSFAFLFGFFVFSLFYKATIETSTNSVLDTFSILVKRNHFLTLFFIAFTLFGSVKVIFEKKEKSEKEYHALRCEIIEKSKDLWKGDKWNQRHRVFEQMKKKYDINLYHQSK